ncbi:MAG: aldo/keto reductase [Bacteroidia bacterium]|nr:aldo/keto reductase [Bacteroidia bacterium]
MLYKCLGNTSTAISAIGQGTMGIGGFFTRDAFSDGQYIEALQFGIENGLTFIDTAEAYGEGHAEELIGRAIKDKRKDVFIASKVSPENLRYEQLIRAAEASLSRMDTDYIDLYQIHWPNPAIPIEETLAAMEKLIQNGKIRYAGVSNFSLRQLQKAMQVNHNIRIQSNQVEYNLFDRTIEYDLLPYCERESVTVIAYSPLDNGKLLWDGGKADTINKIAGKYNRSVANVILRWLLSKPSVIVIPKAGNIDHIKENSQASDFDLEKEDIELIDRTYVTECIKIPIECIKVDKNGLDKFVPSVNDLAADIQACEILKPIRVKRTLDAGQYEYVLLEGKVRYWAWVIAHNGKVPIQALVR